MSEKTEKCVSCEREIDTENDCFIGVPAGVLCEDCESDELQNASTAFIITPEDVTKYFVTDYFSLDGEYSDYANDLFSRTYVQSDGWRGYYETTIPSYIQVEGLSGWTTGAWDDDIARGKRPFNEWAEELLTGAVVPPVNVAIVLDPTSNVFAIATSIWVKPNQLNEFLAWINEDAEGLKNALA